MYCGKCGKEMPDQAAFCPQCGAANSRAKAPAARPAVSLPGKSIAGLQFIPLVLGILGVLHVLTFFTLAYAERSSGSKLLGFSLPKQMTAQKYIAFTFEAADEGLAEASTVLVNTIICLLPVLLGLLIVVLALLVRNKKGYLLAMGCAVVNLLIYLLLSVAMQECESLGYEMTSGGVLGCLLSVITVATACAGAFMGTEARK